MNVRDRRGRQAAHHKAELESALLHARLLSERLHHLMNSDPYKAGFYDGVTVAIRQLKLWLAECEAQAWLIIRDRADQENEHFLMGAVFANEWIRAAQRDLGLEVGRRAHEVAPGHQEEVRDEGPGAGDRNRGGVPAGDDGREPAGA